MTEDIREVLRAQLAEHLRVERQLQLQAQQRKPAPEAQVNNAMLLVSPFGKLAEDTDAATRSTGRGMTLAAGSQATASPAAAEPELWMSGLATLLGLVVLFAALRSAWE